MKFGTGSNAERTQKYGGSKYKMTYVRPYIYKQTNIPNFQLCYPCKCLARYARSPIILFSLNNNKTSLNFCFYFFNIYFIYSFSLSLID